MLLLLPRAQLSLVSKRAVNLNRGLLLKKSRTTWSSRMEMNIYRQNYNNLMHLHTSVRSKQQAEFITTFKEKTMEQISLNPKARMVNVTWSDGKTDSYPFTWLRDNCQCSSCFPSPSVGRRLLLQELDVHCEPSEVWMNKSESGVKGLNLRWSDGHNSSYEESWLAKRAFNADARKQRSLQFRGPITFWRAEMNDRQRIPQFHYDSLLESDKSLFHWLQNLEQFGFTLISNVPRKEGHVQRLADRVGFMRRTHYNLSEFLVKSKNDPSNLAYTNMKLSLHTDLPYYEYIPGIQILHCINQCHGKGGETIFCDGFAAGTELKCKYPEAFHLLSTTPLYFCDVGTDAFPFYKINNTPTIQLNVLGEIDRLNVSAAQRDSYLDVDVEMVQPLYEAMRLFDDILHHPNNLVKLKLKEGEAVAFNNKRILHGREPFESDGSERFLSAGYLDWDEALSRLRVLRAKLYSEEEAQWFS